MNFHRLLWLVSPALIASVKATDSYDAWMDANPEHWLSGVEYERARYMAIMHERKATHKPLETCNGRDSLVTIYNWALVYAGKWNVRDSYERFIAFATKHNFKSITMVPKYSEVLRMAFEYISIAVEQEALSDDILSTSTTGSFVRTWIADYLVNVSTHRCIRKTYRAFLDKCGYPMDDLGVDDYFKTCYHSVAVIETPM